uniref:acyltransferase family protein n=1 Tax=Dyella silvatica TaxID=2992128 RepID=UPI002253BF9B
MTHNRLGFRADIEGLRAIAIVLVVAAHAKLPGFQGGFVGVDVFFVLSGYLITALLVSEMSETGRLDLMGFYARRFRRLLPGLLTMLLVSCLLASLLLSPNQQMAQAEAAASAALWISNFHFAFSRLDYFSAGAESSLFLHTWSLGVEEQFYLVWPILLVLTLGLWQGKLAVVRRLPWLRVVMTLVIMVSLTACVCLTRTQPAQAFYMMPTRAWQFGLGALTWLCLRQSNESRWAAKLPVLGWLGLTMIVGVAMLYSTDLPYPGLRAMVPSLGAALVIASGAGATQHGHGPARLLSTRLFQAFGKISYSWYLWHWPILLLGAAWFGYVSLGYRLGLVAISLILALLSYRLVESPIRQRASLVARPSFSVVVAVLTMLMASTLCLRWQDMASDPLRHPEQVRISSAHVDSPVIYGMGCDDWYHSAEVKPCHFGAEQAQHTAVLIGDSIGAQWFPAINRTFDRPGWQLLVITKSACAMVDKPQFYVRIGREYVEC